MMPSARGSCSLGEQRPLGTRMLLGLSVACLGTAHLAADGKAAMAKLSMHMVSEACVAGETRSVCGCSVPCASRVPTNHRPPSALIEAGQANRLEGSLTCVFLA